MGTLQADRLINARAAAIAAVLLNVSELAAWNPAITKLQTSDTLAVARRPYPISTRVPGRATLTYTRIEASVVEWELTLAGGVEVGVWSLEPRANSTLVTHEMHHSGPTFAVLSSAMRNVPGLRLERLQHRLQQLSEL